MNCSRSCRCPPDHKRQTSPLTDVVKYYKWLKEAKSGTKPAFVCQLRRLWKVMVAKLWLLLSGCRTESIGEVGFWQHLVLWSLFESFCLVRFSLASHPPDVLLKSKGCQYASCCSGEVRLRFVFWVGAPVSVTTQWGWGWICCSDRTGWLKRHGFPTAAAAESLF